MSRLRSIVLSAVVIVYSIYCVVASKTVETNHNLAKCLQSMIHNDIATPIRNIQISIETDSKLENWKFGEIVDQFLMASSDFDVMFEIDNQNASLMGTELPIHRRIMFVDSIKSFKRLVRFQRTHNINVSGVMEYFYVILPSTIGRLKNVLQQFTTFCLENMIADVNILVEDSNGGVAIYSYYPFTPTSCRNSKPILFNYYRNGSFKKRTKAIFPPKLKNLWQCPLTVILWEQPPYVQNSNNPDQMFGVDVEFLKFFKNNMNFTCKVVKIPFGPGEIYPNGTITKGFKMLNDRLADLMLTGVYVDLKRVSHFAATNQYFCASIRLILNPADKFESLSILLFPFDQVVWLTILFVIIGKWICKALWRLSLSKKFYFSKRLSLGPLTIIWLLWIMIFRSSYEGSIYKFLHNNPSKRLPQNLEEADAEGYTFITRLAIMDLYGQNPNDYKSPRLQVLDVTLEETYKSFLKFKGKYALIANGEYLAGFRNEKSPFREDYQRWIVAKTPIFNIYTAMYMPKFSFLTSVLNSRILHVHSSGLSSRIYRNFIADEMKRRQFVAGEHLPVKMSTVHFSGAFQLLAGFLAVAGCVFLIEIFSARNRSAKKLLDIFHRA